MASELAYEGSDESSENELLEKSLSVWRGWNAVGREDFAPVPLDLHTACSIGHFDSVRSFIHNKEEDLNRKNKGGWTPLMYACYIGHDNIVNLLLEASVDVNCKNLKGQTPLMLAASCGNESVGYFLCQQGAELEAQDKKGWTALFHATYSGHQNMVKFLLEQGCNINATERCYGITPFMEAAAEGHEIIVQIFLQHGVTVNAKTFSGDMARSLALMKGHMKIVSLIDNHLIQTPLRSEPGLFADLSSSDEAVGPSRPHSMRSKSRLKGPSIRDGPEAFARYLDRSRCPEPSVQPLNSYIPNGYVTFNNNQCEGENAASVQIRSRDVTSPISANDHTLDSSADSLDNDEDWNSFSKTGALTIKSNSSSSGGLAAALGISRDNSLDSNEDIPGEVPPPQQPVLDRQQTEQLSDNLPCQRTPADGANGQDDCSTQSHISAQDRSHFPSQTTSESVQWSRAPQDYSLFSQSPNALLTNNHGSTVNRRDGANTTVSAPLSEATLPSDIWRMQINPLPTSSSAPSKQSISDVMHDVRPFSNVSTVTADVRPVQQAGRANLRVTIAQMPTFHPRTGQDNLVRNVTLHQDDGRPKDLSALLEQIGMSQYKKTFYQQDVDLQVFLSLTENDLKELGVQLFGHRRKMTIAIARWHSNAKLYMSNLEQVYANKLEAEMQEMAIQLHKVYEENDRLKAQVLQERELRSVTESCLMEERAAWQHTQHLVRDTRQCCDHLMPVLRKLRYQQCEVKRRSLPETLHWEEAESGGQGINPQVRSSSANTTPPPSFDDLFWKIDYFLKHLEQNINLIRRNTDRLFGSQPQLNIAAGPRGV
ncbi:ankyrin repeat and SAM domain-containing protein 3-like isoform X2 [Liolophura sinensis]|uniref:ankyrin repeat and SAM domain-containing protein 3-like isoform X2 n=1 Tax=Liolophura sinensis TaxID=3198878 RepID=UPI0031587E0B